MTDITQISDEMLRELWLSEQLPASVYSDEMDRRRKVEPQSIGALAEKVVATLDEKPTARELIQDWIIEGTEDLPRDTPVVIKIGNRSLVLETLGALRDAR